MPTYLPAVRYGGPITSVHGLCRGLIERGHDVHVFTTNVDGPGESDVPLGRPVDLDGVKVWYFPVKYLRRLYWAPSLASVLAGHIGEFDIVHLHSLFLWPTLVAARLARRAKVPYVVAPRGMLEKGLVRRKNSLVKSAWLKLFERKTLENAAAIHSTSARETVEATLFGFRLPPVFVVPNGVDFEDSLSAAAMPSATIGELIGRGPYVLFLGRINWKKGLDRLISSLQYAPNATLVLAGNDEEHYQPILERLAKAQGVDDRIVFTGPVRGGDKSALLRHAKILVLPSYSENFGNVVLEAMAVGCPVVVTSEVGIADVVRETGSGQVVEGDPELLGAAIANLLADPTAMQRMGEQGKRAVAERFTWAAVAQQMENNYKRFWEKAGPRCQQLLK